MNGDENSHEIVKDLLIQELVDNIPDVIYFKDKEGRLILVNKAHAAGLGLKPKEVVGKTDYDFFPKDQADRMTRDDQYVMRTGLPIIDVIERTTQPNGSHHCVSTTKLPRMDKDGKIIGIMGITRDITERTRLDEQRDAERKKAEEELKRLTDKLEFEKVKLEQILGIEEALNTIVKIDKLAAFVVAKTSKILCAERCSLMLLDEETQQLSVVAYKGLNEEFVQKEYINNHNSIAPWVVRQGVPVLVKDIETDRRFSRKNRASYTTKSFMSVPLKLDDHLIGVINVADKFFNGQHSFSETDLKVLNTLASHVAVAIENAKLYKELNYLTISDPLTNMYNYRHFAISLDSEIKRMRRYSEELCLLMIDVDDFKTYNDTFGHLEGDNLLKTVSRVLKEVLREVDIACRYAGDEFVVILPKTSLKDAQLVAEKIKIKIENLALKKPITLSIGVAQCSKEMDRHDLTLKADSALYDAKKKGKNRVCCSAR